MTLQEPTAQGVRYLLGLVDEPVAGRVCARLGIDADGAVGLSPADRGWLFSQALERARGSAWSWMLEGGHPVCRSLLDAHNRLPLGYRYDLQGRPASQDEFTEGALVAALYQAHGSGTLRHARAAADRLRGAHWPAVMKAHDERPLPGFARWALAERLDCPPVLRAAFGTHAKFRHRLRQAGIYESPVHFVFDAPCTAAELLPVLGLGRWAFPARLAEAEEVLAPTVRAQLGADPEAWAVLAQLLPGFAGSLTELLTTAGAIAGSSAAA